MANWQSLRLINFKPVTDNLNQEKLFHNISFIHLVTVRDLK